MRSNAELHKEMDEAIVSGDFDAVRALISEDVVNHIPGNSPLAGDHRGREFFFRLLEETLDGGSVSVEHHGILDNGSHTVALSTILGSRAGNTLRVDGADLCRWHDGKLVEEWVVPFDQRAWDEFWS